MPDARRPDQAAPAPVSPTGVDAPAPLTGQDPRAQAGGHLTSSVGVRVDDTDHSLRAGRRGPTLLEDQHLREKVSHFDHERIPERVVHARGAAAHGTFTAYGTAEGICRADVFREGRETPVFVRFSTVLGSRGSADTAREVRGFAAKFYTREGNWDLVGNNIPVFFINDGIKFPDLIHAAKPHPDREIPTAQTAHDTFWDFVSQHTESAHMLLWAMSDRTLPRSYSMMEGFGVHTFRLDDAEGATVLVKFHWKPKAGVHSLVWEEAQLAAGFDPDFNRRALAESIESGAYPEWELGIQVFPDTPDQTFEGIDLLDDTKLVPEELAPVQPIGKLVLDRNPTNFFAETEQVAFCTSHVVPGVGFTDDPMLAARNFSYQDTQLTRLGGPNFNQIPINRPHVPVDDGLRDGFSQMAVHQGVTPYVRNALDGDRPRRADREQGAYVDVARPVSGTTWRGEPGTAGTLSFDDHYPQARMFWLSMTPVERDHIVDAFTFELGKCYEQSVKESTLRVLAQVDAELTERVADGLGLPAPQGTPPEGVEPSPALSQVVTTPGPVAGRVVGVVADRGSDLAGVRQLREELLAEGVQLKVISAAGGVLGEGADAQVVERTLLTTRSIEFDAVVVAAGTTVSDPRLDVLLREAYGHCKVLAAWGDGTAVLDAAGIDTSAPGVLSETSGLVPALGLHRAWDRAQGLVTA